MVVSGPARGGVGAPTGMLGWTVAEAFSLLGRRSTFRGRGVFSHSRAWRLGGCGLECYICIRIWFGRGAGVRHGPPGLDGTNVPCVDAFAVWANGRGVVGVR